MAVEGNRYCSYCIGDHEGAPVGASEKREIESQIGQFYPNRSVRQLLSFCMVAAGVCFFFVTFQFMPQFHMWIFFITSLTLLMGGIFLWALGGCIPYAAWKRAVKHIRKHDLYKIRVNPQEYVVRKGFYKETYVSFEVEGNLFDEYFPVQDDVYKNKYQIELWAYYLEYTEKERRKDRSLGKYGIFIVGKERS